MNLAPLLAGTVIVALLPFLFLGGTRAPDAPRSQPAAHEAPRPGPEAPRPMAVVAGLEARLNALTARLEGNDARIAEATAALRNAEAQSRVATEAQAALTARLEARIAEAARAATEADQRAAAAEARAARLSAQSALRDALASGAPLSAALSRLPGAAPAALARFATATPPTEATLRQAFEDTARAARAGGRSLFTVRRGEDVVVGDAAEADVERARRLLSGGDLAGAVQQAQRVAGMAPWVELAQPVLAARAAIAALGAE